MRCPSCRTPTTWQENAWRPFCSERCRLIDLGMWLTEQYRIPEMEADEVEADDPSRNEESSDAAE